MEAVKKKKSAGKIIGKVIKIVLLTPIVIIIAALIGVAIYNIYNSLFVFYKYTPSPDQSYYVIRDNMSNGRYKEENGILEIPSIHFGKEVKAIDYYGFELSDSYIQKETTLVINDEMESIEDFAFSGWKFKNILLSDGLTSIGREALGSLDDINLLEYEGGYYLGSEQNPYMIYVKPVDKGLNKYTIQQGTKFIYDGAFENCIELTDIIIPDSVTHIGSNAFEGCVKLQNVALCKNIVRIGDAAFKNCEVIQHISIPDSINKIGNAAFENCYMLEYNEYENGKYLGNSINPYLCLTDVIDTSNLTEFTISDKTKIIYDGVLGWSLGEQLAVIEIPSGVTDIGMRTFEGCGDLQEIIIPNNVEYIGFSAFDSCDNLQKVTIGKNIKRIEEYAFANCSNLTTIIFEGTKAEWKAVSRSDVRWHQSTGEYTVYCSDGEVSKRQTEIIDENKRR